MRFTVFRHMRTQRVPVVTALFLHKGRSINVDLPFVVDTAAKKSIITPKCEARLKLNEPSIPWNKLFLHGDEEIDTILGRAVFKRFREEAGLRFLNQDKITSWDVRVDPMLFSDDTRLGVSKVVPGWNFPFSILGQDVLKQCGMVSVHEWGILTPDAEKIDTAIRRLIGSSR